MNIPKYLIIFGLCLSTFNNNYASQNSIASSTESQEIFATVAEKRELCRSLGIEYTHEITMSPDLQEYILRCAAKPEAQAIFAADDIYQFNMEHQERIRTDIENRSVIENLIIKRINAIVGYGVFASTFIKRGTCLGIYSGELKIESILNKNNDYYFDCPSITPGVPDLIIDAQNKRNELAFINGSIDHANCQPQKIIMPTGEARFLFVANQNIQAGEQLLADYGAGYWQSHRRHQYQELWQNPAGTTPVAKKKTKDSSSTFGSGFKKGFLN